MISRRNSVASLKLGLLAGCAMLASLGGAKASVVENVQMTFESGATFSGNVTFADDFTYYFAVTGVLSGGPYGSDSMNWVWGASGNGNGADPGANYSLDPNTFQNWLMDGPGPDSSGGFTYFITFGYDYSSAPTLAFFANPIYNGNNVEYTDPMVSGSITPAAVPLPAALPLFAGGIAGLSAVGRWRRKRGAGAALLAA